jgi:cell division protein FtsL
MTKKLASDIVELLGRAGADAVPKNVPLQKSSSRTATPNPRSDPPPSRRDVYGGNLTPQAKQSQQREYVVPQGNKKIIAPKKRRSTFNIVAVLFLSAIAIVLYIGNILKVNHLVVEVSQLQTQYDKIQNANDVLRSEINRKSAWGRIGDAAKQQGLTYPKERAQTFEVDEGKLEKFKEK